MGGNLQVITAQIFKYVTEVAMQSVASGLLGGEIY